MIIDVSQLQDNDSWYSPFTKMITGKVDNATKGVDNIGNTIDSVGKSADNIAKTTTAVYNDYQASKPALFAFAGLVTIALLGYVIETSIDIKQKATKGK